jgi:hypothetical protein
MGLVWGLVGFLIIINPTIYSSYLHQYVDFRGIEWVFGGGLILLGVFFIRSYFKNKSHYVTILMCPKCIKPFNKSDCPELLCPECKTPVEKIAGFYDRHPELK